MKVQAQSGANLDTEILDPIVEGCGEQDMCFQRALIVKVDLQSREFFLRNFLHIITINHKY